MPKIWYRNHGFNEKSPLLGKRFVWRETQDEEKKAPEAEKSLGQKKIEEYRGLSTNEAGQRINSIIDTNNHGILKQIDNWNAAGLRSKVEFMMGRGVFTLGQMDDTRKRRLDRELTRAAKEAAQKKAQEILSDNKQIEAYASNAVNILGYKVKACENLTKSIDEEIADLTKRRDIISKANTGLRKILNLKNRASDFLGQPFSSNNLRGRISRLEDMRKQVVDIQEESNQRVDIKNERTEKIQGWESDLRSLAGPYLDTEEKQEQFENELRGAVLSGTKKAFLAYLHTLGVGSSSEMKAMQNIVENLCEGNNRGSMLALSRSEYLNDKFEDRVGAITKEHVRQYFLNKVAKVAETNVAASTEKHIEKIEEMTPGQKIKVEEVQYILIRKDPNGALFKEKGGDAIGYLDFSKKDQPVFSMEWEAGKQKYAHMTLEAAQNSKSVDSLDFAVQKKDVKKNNTEEKKGEGNDEQSTQNNIINAVARTQNLFRTAA